MSIIKITKYTGCFNCGEIYDEEAEDCPNCSDPYIHCPHCNQLSFDKNFDQCDDVITHIYNANTENAILVTVACQMKI